jgi:hypothetical protein
MTFLLPQRQSTPLGGKKYEKGEEEKGGKNAKKIDEQEMEKEHFKLKGWK